MPSSAENAKTGILGLYQSERECVTKKVENYGKFRKITEKINGLVVRYIQGRKSALFLLSEGSFFSEFRRQNGKGVVVLAVNSVKKKSGTPERSALCLILCCPVS